MSLTAALASPLESFKQEADNFHLIAWSRETISEKLIYGKRMIQTMQTFSETKKVFEDFLQELDKKTHSLLDQKEMGNQLQILFFMFAEQTLKIAPEWKGVEISTLIYFSESAKKYPGYFKEFYLKILAGIGQYLRKTEISEYDLEKLRKKDEFRSVAFEYVQNISIQDLKDWQDFSKLVDHASKLYPYQWENYKNDCEKIEKTLQEKIRTFVSNKLADTTEPHDLAFWNTLRQKININTVSVALDPELREKVHKGISDFFDDSVVNEKDWAVVEKMASDFYLSSPAFEKRQIKELALEVLVKKTYTDPESEFLRLLRLEKMFMEQIVSKESLKELLELKNLLPVQLSHLHNETLRQAEKLLK